MIRKRDAVREISNVAGEKKAAISAGAGMCCWR